MNWLNNKWISTCASIWIQWSCGASYTFSIYSSVLKTSQGYDQSTLDTVSVFKDMGANFGILSGLLYSAVTPYTDRRGLRETSTGSKWKSLGGPWVVHATGAIQCFIGFFFIWASVVGLIHRPPVALMCFFAWLGSNGQTFLNTTNVVTGLRNFPEYSGTIVGIMKGFLGLSGAILIQLYHTFCDSDPTTYLLMLSLLPTVICLVFMPLVRIYERNDIDDKKHLNGFSVVTVIIVAYLMIIILLQNILTFPQWLRALAFSILIVVLASPFGIAIQAQCHDSRRNQQPFSLQREPFTSYTKLITSSNTMEDAVEYEQLPSGNNQVKAISSARVSSCEEELNLLQAMCTINFWLLIIAMISGLGSGLTTVNNVGQIGQSLGYTTIEINNFVSLWSLWNFLGRFGGGYLSDYVMHKKGWPRPLLMAAALAIMILGHVVIASGFPGNLYLGPVLVGVCYGANWSLMPTISSDIFGIKHMGTIFNTIAVASPLGSYILSVRVVGYIYDKEANKDNICYGNHCFMSSFLILAGVACVSFLAGLALYFRTRKFYQSVVLRRLHNW